MTSRNYLPGQDARDNFELTRDVPSKLISGVPSREIPRVSIVTPEYHRPLLLRESIQSALAQRGFDDYELVIVDDEPDPETSAEATVRLFNDPRLVYYRNDKNLGMIANYNRCIALARGEWITFLHNDDWISPHFLTRMMAALPDDAQLLTCRVREGKAGYDPALLSALGRRRPRPAERIPPRSLILRNISPAPGVLFKRREALELGGFDERFYPCSDYDFNIRMVLSGHAYVLDEPLAYYRNTNSMTYKGDTLARMIAWSKTMKRGLVEKFPGWRSNAYYAASMAGWYRRGAENGVHLDREPPGNGPERLARSLFRHPTLAHYFDRVVRRL